MADDSTFQLLNKLLEKAADTTSEGITIADMTQADQPLIYVNDGFERLTGYSKEEVLGKNCRFLQRGETDPVILSEIRAAIEEGREHVVELRNFKKDGTPFWNRLSITPIRSDDITITHYVGVQSDITEIKETRKRLEEANFTLSEYYERVSKDLDQARAVQNLLLPSHFPQSAKVRFASKFVPMDEIGGDFYDIMEIDSGVFGTLIADVSGHGIPAALLTFTTSTCFKNTAPGLLSSAATLNLTNQILFKQLPEDAFVTMFYAIYDSNSRKLNYCQAGHPAAMVLRAENRQIISLETGGTIVGAFSNEEVVYTQNSIQLRPGDRLLLYTDALIDAIDGVMLSNETDRGTLESFLNTCWDLSLQQLMDAIYVHGLEVSTSDSYPDDFTLVGFEVMA